MRSMQIVCGFSLLIALASSPVAVADPSWAKVEGHLYNVTSTNADNLSNPYSASQVMAYGAFPDVETGEVFVSASASTLDSSALAQTATLDVYVSTKSTPHSLLGVEIPSAGSAAQEWEFTAAQDGFVTFNALLDYHVDLMTSGSGEYAGGWFLARIGIATTGNNDARYSSFGTLHQEVYDGDDFSESLSTTLSVTSLSAFHAGETGYLGMDMTVLTEAWANTVVPLPPALLLGLLGMGAAGLKLRKYT